MRALLPAILLGALAFVLACQPLSDYDVWWHVRTGEWILAHQHVPDLDPFTFGSADQHWIDLHWLFQIGMALAFRAGGVPGTILLTAALAAIAVVIALSSVRRPTSWTVVLLIWVPALVLVQSRFRPRPEMVTLVCLAAFLAILSQVERRPRLIWLLPAIQLFWVNSHGLFVLGPIVLAFWLIDRLARRWMRTAALPLDGPHPGPPPSSRSSRSAALRIGLASFGVVLACWCSPYGNDGAVFPFVLYPKVTAAGNPYKEYIDEFLSPQLFYLRPTERLAQAPLLGCFHFLLLFLPLSFVLPPIWRSAHAASKIVSNGGTSRSLAWLGILLALVFLLAVHVLAVLMPHPPAALAGIGKAAPVLILLTGLAGSFCLRMHSRVGALLSAVSGIALMAAMVGLADRLTNSTSPGRPMIVVVGLLALLTGASAAFLAWRLGMSLFSMLLAGAFGYLAWQATNSLSRFGLVAGMLMAWNLGPWVAELVASLGTLSWQRWLRWVPATTAITLLAAWGWAAGTDHYPRWLNQFPPPGLHEYPLVFAHDAVRFAGQPGMPQRALVYDVGQACVYVYHNAPEHLPYMDARLETPTRQTFENYVHIDRLLDRGAPGWAEAIHELGDPVLLLAHESKGVREATVLVHSHWRLVYADALASVFLPRGDKALETRFPTLDLGERHFRQPASPSVPAEPGASWSETMALFRLGLALSRYPDATWRFRIPALLSAHDRALLALKEGPSPTETWTLLGQLYLSLSADLRRPPLVPADKWDPSSGIRWAQATYCFRRAEELAPGSARRLLSRSMLARQIMEPLGPVASLATEQTREQIEPARAVLMLLKQHRLVDATRLALHYQKQGQGSWPWETADALAGAWMHLGYPAQARQVWQTALQPPSKALQQARLGSTFWVEQDYPTAIAHYRQAEQLDPKLAEPSWALAWLNTERGDADQALSACREARKHSLPAPAHADLADLEKLLCRYVPAGRCGATTP